MHEMFMPRDGPTLRGRVESLLGCLEGLRARFKDAVARVFGGAAARAVRDWMRSLLGGPAVEEDDEGRNRGRHDGGGLWGDDDDELLDAGQAANTPARSGLPGWLAWCLTAIAPVAAWLLSVVA